MRRARLRGSFVLAGALAASACQADPAPEPAREPAAARASTARTCSVVALPLETAKGIVKDPRTIESMSAVSSDLVMGEFTQETLDAFRRGGTEVIDLSQLVGAQSLFDLFNANAGTTHGLDRVARDYPHLRGASSVVAVLDMGAVLAQHVQFLPNPPDPAPMSRVTLRTGRAVDYHATHVAGTIASAGHYRSKTKGMAPAARLLSYSAGECRHADAFQESIISNHSTVVPAGWHVDGAKGLTWWGPTSEEEDPRFGAYDQHVRYLDIRLYNAPGHLAVAAAGNDPPDAGFNAPHRDEHAGPHTASGTHRNDNRKGGFDTVNTWCVAKNALCVGSMLDRTSEQSRIERSFFSSMGPADDGRMKPELLANGHNLRSLGVTSPSAEGKMKGTSSAAPVVSGIAALLAEHLADIRPSAALLKAILVHTADDAGDMEGPDAKHGYGAVNVYEAIKVSRAPGTRLLRERVSVRGPREFRFDNDGIAKPKITIAWTDPPAAARTYPRDPIDDPTPTLVNDIDLEVIGPNGRPALPWVLNPNDPQHYAMKAPNRVDNLEVVEGVAERGTWTVRLRAARLGVGVDQEVAVVITGLN